MYFLYAAVAHSTDMTEPSQSSIGEKSEIARHDFLCQKILVRDTVLPADAQYSPETTHVGGTGSRLRAGVQGLGFTAAQECAEYAT